MPKIYFEKINPLEHPGAKTVRELINMHRRTVADINRGKIFMQRGRDVTGEIHHRCLREIAQCEKVLDALRHLSVGSSLRAADLLEEIQEYLPGER